MGRAVLITAFAAAAVLAAGCGGGPGAIERSAEPGAPPQRIVSLAPSLTETLFALDLGNRVVGVTRYCSFPSEVNDLPKVGGHLDPNFEAIVALDPDLVVAIPSSHESSRRLESFGFTVLEIDQHDVDSVLESVVVVAEQCGVPESGRALRARLEARLTAIEEFVADAARPRAVVVVGHQTGDNLVRSVWAAGPDTFYDGVLRRAGGINAVGAGMARYPELSREGLASLDPEVVVDVIAGLEERDLDVEAVRSSWMRLTELRAVRERRINVLVGDQMVVPGPRLPEMVEAVARALHPGLMWETE
jgi:iron complex transport system substrate-binding protein